MTQLAIIGGTGLSKLSDLEISSTQSVNTPYGAPSAEFFFGNIGDLEIIFLTRHGNPSSIPPHKINYRANIWALKELGVSTILAVAAVGGITADMAPSKIVIPNQLIDYSYGREHTFFDVDLEQVVHIDFSQPYSENVRQRIIQASNSAGIDYTDKGVYGCTQGPRLETPAEIERMRRDGCDLVGMTGMPEAALARELELDYATCAVVANWAAGVQDTPITMNEILQNLDIGMVRVMQMLQHLS